ncbi:MAG: ABC transporter ATP-binding protein [Aggregatilineales bacterium]
MVQAVANPNSKAPTRTVGNPIVQAEHICKTFNAPGGAMLPVLQDINLTLREGEVLALLGRSGSGKSTLLRILAGLIHASEGQVLYNGKPIQGPNQNVTMIFQSFALLPWLTVEDNVSLGLKAKGVAKAERHERALKAIDMVGLDGFESAFPRELSGGMRQRVGFARAFVMQPDALFMDEPFSALDVLTSENLRGELMELWTAKKLPTRAILIVTHNIEEAVQLADRVIILGQNPGRVRTEIAIELAHPRDRKSTQFAHMVDTIYKIMTNPQRDAHEIMNTAQLSSAFGRLPHVRAEGIAGFIDILQSSGEGPENLYEVARALQLATDDLLPIADVAQVMGFISLTQGDIALTDIGRQLAQADILQRKHIFRDRLKATIPLAQHIYKALFEQRRHTLAEEFFEDILDEHFTEDETRQQMDIIIDWGRYAELFEYDATRKVLILSEPDAHPQPQPVAAAPVNNSSSGGTSTDEPDTPDAPGR